MLLAKARDDARRGELPPREGFAFPPTRFAGDIEWRPEGHRSTAVSTSYRTSGNARQRAADLPAGERARPG
jgi:hypothetical protein